MGEVWNNYALLMSIGFSAKKYISDRGDFNNNWPQIHRTLRVLLYNLADTIILQRKFQLALYEKFVGEHKLKIIKNHFPESSLKRINEIKDSVQRGDKMVCISRLIPSKRIDRVLSVFSRIAESSNYELVIIGDDDLGFELKPTYLRFIEENGISNRVSFLAPDTDVFKVLSQSKIFIFGSESEGMPNVLIEALYAGNHVCTFEDFLEIGSDAIESYHVFPTEDEMVEGLLHLIGKDTAVSMDPDFFHALNFHFRTIQLFKEEILNN
jgi:glycosyltransferase involved in cell wall biosynthesis